MNRQVIDIRPYPCPCIPFVKFPYYGQAGKVRDRESWWNWMCMVHVDCGEKLQIGTFRQSFFLTTVASPPRSGLVYPFFVRLP